MNSARAIITVTIVGLLAFLVVSCVPQKGTIFKDNAFEDESTQLQIRSLQSREFDTGDRISAMRAVIATLQDLDFVINEADSSLGVITATRMSGYLLSATVAVTEKDDNHMLVRARMQTGWMPMVGKQKYEVYGSRPVSDDVYQEFFYSLRKNLFVASRWLPLPKSSSSK